MRACGNPGSTRNLQLLLFLFFVAWRTRQVGARFDGEPSDGNDRSALRQRKVLRRQTEGRQRLLVSGKRDDPPLCHQNLRRIHDHFQYNKTRYIIPLERLPFIQIFTRRSVHVTVDGVPVTHIVPQCLNATYWRTPHSFRTFKEKTGFQVL